MGDSSVNRLTVIQVLKRRGVGVSLGECNQVNLAKGGCIETQILPDWVEKKMLHYLSRRYKVDIHFFWHPDMIPDEISMGAG